MCPWSNSNIMRGFSYKWLSDHSIRSECVFLPSRFSFWWSRSFRFGGFVSSLIMALSHCIVNQTQCILNCTYYSGRHIPQTLPTCRLCPQLTVENTTTGTETFYETARISYAFRKSLTGVTIAWSSDDQDKHLRWFPSKRTRHRFPMKLGMVSLQYKKMLKT